MMTAEIRAGKIQARFAAGSSGLDAQRLCVICADESEMSGAGIMMMSGGVRRGSLCTTNPVSALVEELQFSLGEGPCLDAFHHDRPVLEPDLADPVEPRWMAFSEQALGAGIRAIFGFPIRVGPVKFGALNLYRDRPGPLRGGQHADCLVLADSVADSLIAMQAHAAPGQLATEFEAGADLELGVHRASGMVAAQLDTSVGKALLRMQAHAFGNDQSLRSVAGEVVRRELRFDDATGPTLAKNTES